jgi:hypothetical protein
LLDGSLDELLDAMLDIFRGARSAQMRTTATRKNFNVAFSSAHAERLVDDIERKTSEILAFAQRLTQIFADIHLSPPVRPWDRLSNRCLRWSGRCPSNRASGIGSPCARPSQSRPSPSFCSAGSEWGPRAVSNFQRNAGTEQKFRSDVVVLGRVKMQTAIDRVIRTYGMMVNLTLKEEQAAREKVSSHLAERPNGSERAGTGR